MSNVEKLICVFFLKRNQVVKENPNPMPPTFLHSFPACRSILFLDHLKLTEPIKIYQKDTSC